MTANQIPDLKVHQLDEKSEYLALSFSPLSAPIRSRWRNNGLSADFLGDFVTTFFSAEGELNDTSARQKEIKHAVTYIANEFLENAMKFHARDVDIPIGIRLELTGSQITISASNGVGTEQAARWRARYRTGRSRGPWHAARNQVPRAIEACRAAPHSSKGR